VNAEDTLGVVVLRFAAFWVAMAIDTPRVVLVADCHSDHLSAGRQR
jgi:hypothetical protein